MPSIIRITRPDARCGWLGIDAAKRAVADIGPTLPRFAIIGAADSSEGKRVVLWDYTRQVNRGSHLPTWRQEIGDCVSMGAANAIDYLACMEIARLGDRERYRRSFPPFIYGVSRMQIGGGKLGLSDGSLGVWAADAVRKFGVLACDEPKTPKYSGDVARTWGRTPGVPKAFLELGKPHCLKTVAQVSNYPQVRDALINGYPVTVASSRGFRMELRVANGKSWGVPAGQWFHQMCFVGVDDDSQRPGCYCLNSWGDTAHGKPADDAPPGGFWVDAEVVESMVKEGDSWAYSQFEGFPARKLNFRLL